MQTKEATYQGSEFFSRFKRMLEMDCDDVDLPEESNKRNKKEIEEKTSENRKGTLTNPFLKDFFNRLSQHHKSKKIWFNHKVL